MKAWVKNRSRKWTGKSLWIKLFFALDLSLLLFDLTTGVPLTDYIRHFEPVHYNHRDLQMQHHRAKRSIDAPPVRLKVEAHGKSFKIRLHRETGLFSPDLVVENSTGPIQYDVNRAYVGHLEGDHSSLVHGIVTSQGLFEGKITTADEQYMIERTWRYFSTPQSFHSVMYKHSDVHMDSLNKSLCLSDQLHKKVHDLQRNETLRRLSRATSSKYVYDFRSADAYYTNGESTRKYGGRRKQSSRHHHQQHTTVDKSKTTCTLYVQADHLFYEKFGSNEEAVIEQLTQHVQGVNEIYRIIDFDNDSSTDNINFIIKRIKVHTDPTAEGYKYSGNYGVESFLELFSEDNFDAFCLAYMFTYRDFDGGTLGLAWTGDLTNAGGVCEQNGHDPETSDCSPGGDSGNYIMFARATSGDKPNNNKFSSCSKSSMSQVMEVKARRAPDGCFVEPTTSICGNGVVEKGEECDCGWDDECTDPCCFPQTDTPERMERPCTRKPGAACSPSEGPCCSIGCSFITDFHKCNDATGCRGHSFCNGTSAVCPEPVNKPDKTLCDDSSVCLDGECRGSICLAYNLDPCQCDPLTEDDFTDDRLCKLCCQFPEDDASCKPSDEWNVVPYNVPDMRSKSGAPCYSNNGYCDVFHKCREGMKNIKDWLSGNWYILMSAVIGLVILMAILTKVCTPKPKQKVAGPSSSLNQIQKQTKSPSWVSSPSSGIGSPPPRVPFPQSGTLDSVSPVIRPPPVARTPGAKVTPLVRAIPTPPSSLSVMPPPLPKRNSPPPVCTGKRMPPVKDWV